MSEAGATKFRQAKWSEPIIFELTKIDPKIDDATIEVATRYLPEKWVRKTLYLPDLAESVVVKHFTRLSQMNYSVDLGLYPLGSCTMKYNPKIDEYILVDELHWVHPEQPEGTVQGLLKILYELGEYLKQLTGFDCVSLQPAAGAHGELAGALIIKKYHETRGDKGRNEMLIPDSAHGTNPASAKMAGFKVVEIPSDERGLVDINALKSALGSTTAGMMMTNPNTLGLFERNIKLIADLVHEAGGLMYYDGANLNAIAGLVRPADLGFDICHLNLHKTFGSPHGGGGPGSGPILVKRFLRSFLPVPIIERNDDGRYYLEWNLENSIGKVHGYYGNIAVLLRAYAYILINGFEGLVNNSKLAVLNSNYLLRKLERLKGVSVPYDPTQYRLHEFVISFEQLKRETTVSALDLAKRLLDYGFHAPTIYFPQIVKEAWMVEPTENASKRDLDEFYEAVKKIVDEAYSSPDLVKNAPYNTAVRRIDDAYGSRPSTMAPTYRWVIRRER